MRTSLLTVLMLALPWLRWGEATDPQFGAAWIVVLALCCAVHARAVSRTTLQSSGRAYWIWTVLAVGGVVAVEWSPSHDLWRWVTALALLFYPWSVSVKPTQGLGMGCNLRWSLGIGLWAFFAPPIVAALKLKGWIPSVDLLFELHAIVLVLWGRANVRLRWVLLVFALMSWLFDARSAALVASMGWLTFQVEHKAKTISFRWATFSATLLGLTLLLVSPWIQSRWTYDAAFEQSRTKGSIQGVPVPLIDREDALIRGSLAERITQWAWTAPRLDWRGHGPRSWQIDAFDALTWWGPPKRKAQRPHNEWIHSMYNYGIWTFGFWLLWSWMAPRSALIAMPMVFLGFPLERPELTLSMAVLTCAFQEGWKEGNTHPNRFTPALLLIGMFIWVLALVRWSQITTSLHVQGKMQRAVRAQSVVWPEVSSWEGASLKRFPCDLQGNDVALFQAMHFANEGKPCEAMSILDSRDPHRFRKVPNIHKALEAACPNH